MRMLLIDRLAGKGAAAPSDGAGMASGNWAGAASVAQLSGARQPQSTGIRTLYENQHEKVRRAVPGRCQNGAPGTRLSIALADLLQCSPRDLDYVLSRSAGQVAQPDRPAVPARSNHSQREIREYVSDLTGSHRSSA